LFELAATWFKEKLLEECGHGWPLFDLRVQEERTCFNCAATNGRLLDLRVQE
jgi:hypothetical protein